MGRDFLGGGAGAELEHSQKTMLKVGQKNQSEQNKNNNIFANSHEYVAAVFCF